MEIEVRFHIALTLVSVFGRVILWRDHQTETLPSTTVYYLQEQEQEREREQEQEQEREQEREQETVAPVQSPSPRCDREVAVGHTYWCVKKNRSRGCRVCRRTRRGISRRSCGRSRIGVGGLGGGEAGRSQ